MLETKSRKELSSKKMLIAKSIRSRRKRMLETKSSQEFAATKCTIRELIFSNNDCVYVIPPYQRPYRWTEEQVGILMADLFDFYSLSENTKERYSLGTIVCDRRNKEFQVLDGQQRLTTMDLILSKIEEATHKSRESHSRLIAAYRYLPGHFNSTQTELPSCQEQRKPITIFFEGKSEKELLKFHDFLLDRVVVRRVEIPLSGKVTNEPQLMFEIINLRGQKLTALDILKARFLSTMDDQPEKERAVFDRFWTLVPSALMNREQKEKSFLISKKDWEASSEADRSRESQTLKEILVSSKEAVGTEGDTKSSEDSGSQEYDCLPPVDFANALVIAWELFKNKCRDKVEDKTEGNPDVSPAALTTTNLEGRFDDLIQGKIRFHEGNPCNNVWVLMGIVRLVLQTASHWGPYRKTASDESQSMGSIGDLAFTFMAANGYQLSGQYWLLMLSAMVLKNFEDKKISLPTDAKSFYEFPTPEFEPIKNKAYEALVFLAYETTIEGLSGATKRVFDYLSTSEESRREKLEKLRKEIADVPNKNDGTGWFYGAGLSRWQLYWVDHLMQLDSEREFSTLKKMMNKPCEPEQLSQALKKFDWDRFLRKKKSIHTVSRGAIEHWLAQDKAGDDQEELGRRHGFGNLALIDQSANSSLGKQGVTDKSAEVIERMSNPSWKLWWLAVFSSKINYGEFVSDWVHPLTEMWGRYLAEFPFDFLTSDDQS